MVVHIRSSSRLVPFVAGAVSGALLSCSLFFSCSRMRNEEKNTKFQKVFPRLAQRIIMDETDPHMKVQRYKELLFLAFSSDSDTPTPTPTGDVDDDDDERQQPIIGSSSSPTATSTSTTALCGRFMKGRKEEDFEILSEEPGKVLSWVCSEEMLLNVLATNNPVEALISIGFRTKYIQERLKDGTQFKLVVFPTTTNTNATSSSNSEEEGNDNTTTTTMVAEVVTWTNLWKLIKVAYGDDIDQALEPFKDDIPNLPVSDSVGYLFVEGHEISQIGDLPVDIKHAHPQFRSRDNFLKIPPKERTIYDARAFLHHSVGCNHRFQGNGLSPDGHVEIMTFNKKLKDIPGAELIDLHVTEDDLNDAIARHGLM